MNEFMSQGILEVEKVLNESQHFQSIHQSIHDPDVQIDEAAELQKVLDMKYSEHQNEQESQIDLWYGEHYVIDKMQVKQKVKLKAAKFVHFILS